MEYDVFISCKNEDYSIAEEVYSYLKDNGFHVFLSPKELHKMKDSEYMDVISEALDSAYHIIVLGTSKENLRSQWVKFEWVTFLNELLSGRKSGQVLTFLEGNISIADLPIQLRHFESFNLNNYQDAILHYVETPAYIERKEEAKKKLKLEEERIRKIKEAEQREKRIRKELEDKKAEYSRHYSSLEDLALAVVSKYKQLGITSKKCPVCNEELFVDASYCKTCGWLFEPKFSEKGKTTEEHLFISQSNWNSLKNSEALIQQAKKDLAKEKEATKKLRVDKDTLLEKLKEQELLKAELKMSMNSLHKQYDESLEKIKMFVSNDRAQKKQLDKAENQIELLRKQIAKTETVIATLSSKAKRFDQLMAEMDELVEKNEKQKRKINELQHNWDLSEARNRRVREKYEQSCGIVDKLKGELMACKEERSSSHLGSEIMTSQYAAPAIVLTKETLRDSMLKSCSTPFHVFGGDRLDKIGFNEKIFRAILQNQFGVTFGPYELKKCKTFESLKKYVAAKVNVEL